MPRCWPSAAASVDLPAPIIPAMPMKMLPNTSTGAGRIGGAGVGPEPSALAVTGGCVIESVRRDRNAV
ncbi:MAG: hypothetical protein H7138_27480 [Myxococcales bacterium]|nr:hypothetical protein [Myxococcales bacterium]